METNETPEKIYIQPSTIEQLPHQNIVYTKPLADNSIEYVHKDAFIENICEWLKEHVLEYVPKMNYGVGKTQPDYYTKNFIESLKKYMNRL